MSVYIKGFPLPNNCGACPLRLAWCRERIYMVTRPERCPLVPVPKHGRLGDLDALEQMFADIDHAPYSGFDGEDPFYSAADAAQIIRLAPTIIPAQEDELQKLEQAIGDFYERNKAEEEET